jgi:hypothetical protein
MKKVSVSVMAHSSREKYFDYLKSNLIFEEQRVVVALYKSLMQIK